MRSTRLTTKFTAHAALSLALGAVVLATSLPARAEEDVPVDTKILRGILEGLGLRKDGPGINYQERAPLVIPPGRALPPPEKSDAALANNPAWPVDPDVKRAKEEAALERKQLRADDAPLRDGRPLRPDEMTPGPKPRTARRTQPDSYEHSPYGSSNPSKPWELGYKGNLFSSKEEETAKFTGEPVRSSLTDPPRGYQTPSPDQPYGAGKTKTVAPTSADYLMNKPAGTQ